MTWSTELLWIGVASLLIGGVIPVAYSAMATPLKRWLILRKTPPWLAVTAVVCTYFICLAVASAALIALSTMTGTHNAPAIALCAVLGFGIARWIRGELS